MGKFILILLITAVILSCHNVKNKKDKNILKSDSSLAKVEVYYFHQTKRCKTCIAVGEVAKQFVMNNYEIHKNKDVISHDVNISLEENQAIADKFQVNWSGLYILAHTSKGDVTENLTEFAFMYAVDKPDSVRKALESKINKYLNL